MAFLLSWAKNKGKTQIKLHQKNIILGRFKKLFDAVVARRNAELIYHKI